MISGEEVIGDAEASMDGMDEGDVVRAEFLERRRGEGNLVNR